MAKLLGAKIGNFHTLTDWGLYLKVGSPKIGAAEPEEYLVQVTGSDSLLNLTTWDDGKVHYKKRTITMELLCNAPKSKWPSIESTIANAIHGKWLQCRFDEDPAWYWEGLWKVTPSRDRLSSAFTITGTCNPFKRSVYARTKRCPSPVHRVRPASTSSAARPPQTSRCLSMALRWEFWTSPPTGSISRGLLCRMA